MTCRLFLCCLLLTLFADTLARGQASSDANGISLGWNLTAAGQVNTLYQSLAGGRYQYVELTNNAGAGFARVVEYVPDGHGRTTTRDISFRSTGGNPIVVKGILKQITIHATSATRGTMAMADHDPPATRPSTRPDTRPE